MAYSSSKFGDLELLTLRPAMEIGEKDMKVVRSTLRRGRPYSRPFELIVHELLWAVEWLKYIRLSKQYCSIYTLSTKSSVLPDYPPHVVTTFPRSFDTSEPPIHLELSRTKVPTFLVSTSSLRIHTILGRNSCRISYSIVETLVTCEHDIYMQFDTTEYILFVSVHDVP
jgi:hypothetical protein